MSNYQSKALNPRNGTVEVVSMLDDYYSKHQYAVAFQDGSKYPENQIVCIHPNDVNDNEYVRICYMGYSAVLFNREVWGGCLYINSEEDYVFWGRTLDVACVEFKHTVDRYRSNNGL